MKIGIKLLKIPKLTSLVITLIISLVCLTSKVNAETYNLDSSQVTSYYRVNNATLFNLNYNTWYSIGSDILSNLRLGFTPLNPKTCTEYGCSEGLQPGQYLFDFYVLTDGAVNISNCNQLSSDFQNVDMTTGNWVSNQISSSCVDVSTYVESGYATYLHILYSFTANAFATEYRFYINYGRGWLNGSSKFKVLLGNVYDFDQTIINDFKQQKLNEQQINQNNTIINQNQTIIDQNQQQTQQDKEQHDEFMNSDISEEDKELPDDSKYQDYTDTENDLKDKVNEADMSVISIGIDANSSTWIWDTLTRLIQSNSIVFGMFIAILSIGIIKLALGR